MGALKNSSAKTEKKPEFMTAPQGLLQRKCACGNNAGLDGECEECRSKKLGLQRRAASNAEPASIPPIVHEVLQSPGEPLDAHARAAMGSKFGHDFSKVRVHADAKAAESAQAVNALAYTVGRDVVFGAGQFALSSNEGTKLLAHELTHVVQQSSNPTSSQPVLAKFSTEQNDAKEREAESAATSVSSGGAINSPSSKSEPALQRDANEDEERLRLTTPQLGFRRSGPRLLPEEETRLQLDPEIEAQMRAMQFTRRKLSRDQILPALLNLDPDLIFGTQPTPSLQSLPTAPKPRLAPTGSEPTELRPATIGDVIRALIKTSAMKSALADLSTRAESVMRSLSTGEKALVITGSAVIAAGALVGVISNPEARSFVLEKLEDQAIPIPGVRGLSFQFRVTGDNPEVIFNLNVGQFLPAEFGFR